jgi:hypothetical protein
MDLMKKMLVLPASCLREVLLANASHLFQMSHFPCSPVIPRPFCPHPASSHPPPPLPQRLSFKKGLAESKKFSFQNSLSLNSWWRILVATWTYGKGWPWTLGPTMPEPSTPCGPTGRKTCIRLLALWRPHAVRLCMAANKRLPQPLSEQFPSNIENNSFWKKT